MALLTLTLLGPPLITDAAGTAPAFRSRKALALLVYLAIEQGTEHSRDSLVGLLWPEDSEEAARNSLRVALANLRQTLGESADRLLRASRTGVQFARDSDHALDVATFSTLLAACRAHRHEQIESCAECAARLAQAVALYRGEFLAGFALPNCAPFEEWLLMQREALRLQALEALTTQAAYHERRGEHEALGRAARRQLILEPWHEPAYRQLMCALALSGDGAAALVAYETCRGVLQRELGVEPEIETRALAERIRAGDLSPVRLSAPPPVYRLPTDGTPFVGRERELAEITARLCEPDVRLVTLVGMGGMGKTRLALEVARARLAACSSNPGDAVGEPAGPAIFDGVFFVPLASLGGAAEIVPAIGAAIGLTLHGGDLRQALLHVLRDKRLLLILDNFEHLLDGVGLVDEIMQSAPHVQLIVTSRERLHLRGEHLYVVDGMEYAVEDAAGSSAVRLFVQSARRVLPGFKLSDVNLPQVLRVCRLVQGMPLGIVLAAAWVELLPVETIAAEIERNTGFLAFDWHDAPERQHSMRAVFDWSWQLLNDAERHAVCGLSVFRGGFTREAAEVVAGASLRVLARLHHKSLLQLRPSSGGSGRYEIHELLRQFAAEQLDAVPEARAAVAARHGAYYLSFVAQRQRRLSRNEPREAAAEIWAEIDNVRQAWAWATAHRRIGELESSADGLCQFYVLTGQSAEREQILELACEAARAYTEQASDDAVARRTLAKLLALYATTLRERGGYDQAIRVAQQAIELAAWSAEGEIIAYFTWGAALYSKGQRPEGRGYMEHALDLCRAFRASNPDSEAADVSEVNAHLWLRTVAISLGEYEPARRHAAQALGICQAQGLQFAEVQCLCNLADVARETYDLPSARAYYERALQLAPAVSSPWTEGMIWFELGDVMRLQGEYTQAYELTERALMMFREIGETAQEYLATAALLRLSAYLGDDVRAGAWLAHFAQLQNTVEAPEMRVTALLALLVYARQTGDYTQALAYAEQCWQLAHEFSHTYQKAHALVLLGHAQAALGIADAAAAYRQALELYATVGNPGPATEAWAGLAALAQTHGDLDQAHAYAEVVLETIAGQQPVGLDEPFYVYLACYLALEANGDPRAVTVLQVGLRLLHAYAGHIADEALRRSFLENVATHRKLLRAGRVAAQGWATPERSASGPEEPAMRDMA